VHLRFTIRDLLWLTLVVALAVGWWIDHRQLASDAAAAKTPLRELIDRMNAENVRIERMVNEKRKADSDSTR
jgi:hypothetical protein